MTAKQMVFQARCPHCTKEMVAFTIFDEQREKAALLVAEDEEAAAEQLREQLAAAGELGDDGIAKGALTYGEQEEE